MAIKKKNNLYSLIKSLTKNEKKFFREFLKKRSSENLYLLLFNIIDRQSKHQAKEIKKLFDNKANQLPVIKTYLQKLIQKVLNFYHHDSLTFDKIQNSILIIRHLLDRELFDLAENEIAKITKILQTSEMPLEQLRVLEFRKELLIKKFGPTSEENKKDLNALLEEQSQLLEAIFNLHQLETLQANFFEHFQQGSGLNPVIYTDLNKNPLVTDDSKALTMKAKLLQTDLTYRMHIYRNQNYAAAEEAIQKGLRHMELTPSSIRENPEEYLNLLNHKLELLIHLRNIPEIYDTLGKIRQAPTEFHFNIKEPHLKRVAMEAYALELEIYAQSEDNKRAKKLIETIDREYRELNSPALRQWRTVMDHEIGKYYFQTGAYEQAQNRLKNIKTAEHSLREKDTLMASYFLRAQIALKQKNNLELKKVSSDIENFFKNERKASRLENHLLKLFQNWPLLFPYPRRHRQLALLANKIQKASTTKPDSPLSDLVDWLQTYLMEELQIKA